jgi:hypothetical protein
MEATISARARGRRLADRQSALDGLVGTVELLEHNRVLMQSQMSKSVRIKHTPHLNFHIDEAMERGSRVLNVMNELGLMEIKPNADEEL